MIKIIPLGKKEMKKLIHKDWWEKAHYSWYCFLTRQVLRQMVSQGVIK